MNQLKILGWFCLMFLPMAFYGQVLNPGLAANSGGEQIKKITVSGYIDAYYGFHFQQPDSGVVPYMVSMNRSNEANINFAAIDLKFEDERLRARFMPGFGTYQDANYANEMGSIKNIIEASIGVKLFKQKKIWIDFGVLGSPFTNESAFSKDQLMYTRSYSAEYAPYYLAGVKATLPLSNKVIAYLYVLNGWQQIYDVNKSKSIATQIEYRPNNKNLINWNVYYGNENSKLNPTYGNRAFTDVYWVFNPEGKIAITSNAYYGVQQQTNNLADKHWWQANFIAQVKLDSVQAISARLEYFNDPNHAVVGQLVPNTSFKTYSVGACYNLKLFSHALFRVDARHFFGNQKVYAYQANKAPQSNGFWLVSSLCFWF